MSKKEEEIIGIIVNVSESQLYRDFKRSPKSGYHHIMLRQKNGVKIKIYLSDLAMGIQDFKKSVIYFINKNTGEMVKTGIVNPRRFIGSKVSVKGMIDKSNEPYYMNRVSEFVLLDRE